MNGVVYRILFSLAGIIMPKAVRVNSRSDHHDPSTANVTKYTLEVPFMLSYHFLLDLALILISTKLFRLLTRKVQMPQVVGRPDA
jgi:hypothetical protein